MKSITISDFKNRLEETEGVVCKKVKGMISLNRCLFDFTKYQHSEIFSKNNGKEGSFTFTSSESSLHNGWRGPKYRIEIPLPQSPIVIKSKLIETYYNPPKVFQTLSYHKKGICIGIDNDNIELLDKNKNECFKN